MLVNDGGGSRPTPKATGTPAGKGNRGRRGISGATVSSNKERTKATRDARLVPKAPKSSGPKKDTNKKSRKVSNKNQSKKLTKKTKPKKVKKPRPKPAPPKKVNPAPLVKTKQTGVPVLALAFSNNTVEQERDILNAFLALSGTELFQYTNERSVDGQFNDVSIISVLSSRRKDYTPNDIIESYPAFIKDVYKGSGADAGKLFFEVEGATAGGSMTVEFYISSSVGRIGSVDFV